MTRLASIKPRIATLDTAPRPIATPSRQQTRALHTGSKAWRIIRQRVLVRDSYTCQLCGQYGDQVDHKDGDASRNDLHLLQVLCPSCHSAKTASEQAHSSKAY